MFTKLQLLPRCLFLLNWGVSFRRWTAMLFNRQWDEDLWYVWCVSALCIQKIPFGPWFMRSISKCVKKNKNQKPPPTTKNLMFQRCKCIQLDLFSWHGKLVSNSVILRERGCFHRQRISINHRCAAVKQCGASSYILTLIKSSPILLWPSKVLMFFSDQFKYSVHACCRISNSTVLSVIFFSRRGDSVVHRSSIYTQGERIGWSLQKKEIPRLVGSPNNKIYKKHTENMWWC